MQNKSLYKKYKRPKRSKNWIPRGNTYFNLSFWVWLLEVRGRCLVHVRIYFVPRKKSSRGCWWALNFRFLGIAPSSSSAACLLFGATSSNNDIVLTTFSATDELPRTIRIVCLLACLLAWRLLPATHIPTPGHELGHNNLLLLRGRGREGAYATAATAGFTNFKMPALRHNNITRAFDEV
jgi:hypothetical protein